MAKDPVFPVYYNDLCRATHTWTDEEFGAYVRLLIEQWDKGFISSEIVRLARLSDSISRHQFILAEKFEAAGPGKLQNPKLEEIRGRREKFKNHQRDNASKRWGKKCQTDAEPDAGIDAKPIPLEIEIEIEKDNKLKSAKIIKTEINIDFDFFWMDYDKKVGDRKKLKAKWETLTDQEREDIMNYIPKYKAAQPDKQFRKNPDTFFNNKSWNDELITRQQPAGAPGSKKANLRELVNELRKTDQGDNSDHAA